MADMIQEVLRLLYDHKRKTEISLIHAEDRRMKNPDCCELCKEVGNLKKRKSIYEFLIDKVMKNG